MSQSSDVDSQVTEFITPLFRILDKHAPSVDRTVVLRLHVPWYIHGVSNLNPKVNG